jgi:hypothetical protein
VGLAAGCRTAWAEQYGLTLLEDLHGVGVVLETFLADGGKQTQEFPVGGRLLLRAQTQYRISFGETDGLNEETPFRKVAFQVSSRGLDREWGFVYRQDFQSEAHPVQDVGSPGAHNRFWQYLKDKSIGLWFEGQDGFQALAQVQEPLHLPKAEAKDEDVEMGRADAKPSEAAQESKGSRQESPSTGAARKLQFQ